MITPAKSCGSPLHPLISSLYTQFSALALELDKRLDALEQRVLREADDQELACVAVTVFTLSRRGWN